MNNQEIEKNLLTQMGKTKQDYTSPLFHDIRFVKDYLDYALENQDFYGGDVLMEEIPSDFWSDKEIGSKLFDLAIGVHETDLEPEEGGSKEDYHLPIPASCWKDKDFKDHAIHYYYYGNYDIRKIYPKEILKNKEDVKELLSQNYTWFEELPKEMKKDQGLINFCLYQFLNGQIGNWNFEFEEKEGEEYLGKMLEAYPNYMLRSGEFLSALVRQILICTEGHRTLQKKMIGETGKYAEKMTWQNPRFVAQLSEMGVPGFQEPTEDELVKLSNLKYNNTINTADYADLQLEEEPEEESESIEDKLNALSDPETITEGDFDFTLLGDELVLTGYHGEEQVAKVPSEVQGKKVVAFGPYAFVNVDSVIGIEVPNTVRELCSNAFTNCDNLRGLYIPSSVTRIGKDCVSDCSDFQIVQIDDVESWCKITLLSNPLMNGYGHDAVIFVQNEKLTDLVIPPSITSLKGPAFAHCTSLTSIHIPATLTHIPSLAFSGCSNLQSIEVDSDNPNYSSKGNCLLSKDGTELICGCHNSVIPEGVKYIDRYAFAEMNDLTSIHLSSSVEIIGEGAFFNTPLNTINLPSSLHDIRRAAFQFSSLSSIIIPSSVAWMYENVFKGVLPLRKVYCECKSAPESWDPDFLEDCDADLFWYSEEENTDGKHWHYVDGKPVVWEK